MSASLAQRLHAFVRSVLASYPDARLGWCYPRGEWKPFLERSVEQRKLVAKRATALARLQDGVVTGR